MNNSPDNLMVFATNEDHIRYHKGGKLYVNEEGIYHCESIKKTYRCALCGALISRKAKMCTECLLQQKHDNSKVRQLGNTDEDIRKRLKEDVRKYSFVHLSKEYGVSDKAICKWCEKYNIPSRKRDIKKYSDEEWNKL